MRGVRMSGLGEVEDYGLRYGMVQWVVMGWNKLMNLVMLISGDGRRSDWGIKGDRTHYFFSLYPVNAVIILIFSICTRLGNTHYTTDHLASHAARPEVFVWLLLIRYLSLQTHPSPIRCLGCGTDFS